jgi:hypothetical protein
MRENHPFLGSPYGPLSPTDPTRFLQHETIRLWAQLKLSSKAPDSQFSTLTIDSRALNIPAQTYISMKFQALYTAPSLSLLGSEE